MTTCYLKAHCFERVKVIKIRGMKCASCRAAIEPDAAQARINTPRLAVSLAIS